MSPVILIISCQWVKCQQLLNFFQSTKGDVLSLDSKVPYGVNSCGSSIFKSVQDILSGKHPSAQPASADALLKPDSVRVPLFDPVLFDCLTGDLIKLAARQTQGAAGPSGVDAYSWRRMCSSFGNASVTLCNSLAAVGCHLCVSPVDPYELMAFVAD